MQTYRWTIDHDQWIHSVLEANMHTHTHRATPQLVSTIDRDKRSSGRTEFRSTDLFLSILFASKEVIIACNDQITLWLREMALLIADSVCQFIVGPRKETKPTELGAIHPVFQIRQHQLLHIIHFVVLW